MKEVAFIILLTAIPLLGYPQKKVFFKPNMTYDTAHARDLNKSFHLDDFDSLNNIFFDDSELCIKFKGGETALVKYLVENFQLPATDKHRNVSGKALASFTVNEKGEVGDIIVEKGLGEEIDNEIRKVISEMPKWIWNCDSKPARPVKTKRYVPFIID